MIQGLDVNLNVHFTKQKTSVIAHLGTMQMIPTIHQSVICLVDIALKKLFLTQMDFTLLLLQYLGHLAYNINK